jgi:hypothetical protein
MSEITKCKYLCEKCGEFESIYDYDKKLFICNSCGHIVYVRWQLKKCWNCGQYYTYYTFFDPSGCHRCGKSFVD